MLVGMMWIFCAFAALGITASIINLAGVTGSIGLFPPMVLQGLFTGTAIVSAGEAFVSFTEGPDDDED
jgi:hypothetical protein